MLVEGKRLKKIVLNCNTKEEVLRTEGQMASKNYDLCTKGNIKILKIKDFGKARDWGNKYDCRENNKYIRG